MLTQLLKKIDIRYGIRVGNDVRTMRLRTGDDTGITDGHGYGARIYLEELLQDGVRPPTGDVRRAHLGDAITAEVLSAIVASIQDNKKVKAFEDNGTVFLDLGTFELDPFRFAK